MSPLQPIPEPEVPLHKGISKIDLQALGLVLMILMVINLPLYQSVLQSSGKPVHSRVVTARRAPVRIAFAKPFFTNGFKPGVSSPTTTSGASNSSLAH